MADSTTTTDLDTTRGTGSTGTSTGSAGTGATAGGRTVVSDAVVGKVAGIAARRVRGVHALGGGAARALGSIRGVVGQQDHAQGVSVEVGERQVAADVVVVAEYPVPLQDVADAVRSSVADAIRTIVGMEVAEIDVTVADVHLPGEDDDRDDRDGSTGPARVR